MKKTALLLIVISFMLTQSTFAHHAWVEKQDGRYKVSWGHPPEVNPYETDRVKEIATFDKKGVQVPADIINEKDAVYLSSKKDLSMVTLSMKGVYYVTTPDGTKRIGKKEAEAQGIQVVDAVYSSQFSKSIFAYSDVAAKSTGMKFEIVTLKDPYKLKTGETLPIKVLFDGKPLEGATIETGNDKEGEKGNKPAGKTDKNGLADITIGNDGMQIILATYRIPTNNPDANFLSFKTALTLVLK